MFSFPKAPGALVVPLLAVLPTFFPDTASSTGVWESIGPEGGRVDGFAQAPTNPDRMYLLSGGAGLFRSDDHGVSWTELDVGPPFAGPVAVSPVDEDLLVMADASGGRFRRSTDGGHTWTTSETIHGWARAEHIAFDPIDPTCLLAAAYQSYEGSSVFLSTDTGLTWVGVTNGIDAYRAYSISFHPTQPGVVFVGTQDGIFRSTDGGSSWAAVVAPGLTGVSYVDHCDANPSRVWATGAGDELFSSDDGGLTFGPTAAPGLVSGEYLRGIAAHPTDPDIVVAGIMETGWDEATRMEGTVRSSDGGATWEIQRVPFHNGFDADGVWSGYIGFRDLVHDVDASSTVYLATSEPTLTGLLRSQDGGVTWASWMHGIHRVGIKGMDWDAAGAVYAIEGSLNGLWIAPGVDGPWEYGAVRYAYWLTQTTDVLEANHLVEGFVHVGGMRRTSWDTWSGSYSQSTDGGRTWAIDIVWPFWGDVYTMTTAVASNHGNVASSLYVWESTMMHRSLDGYPFTEVYEGFEVSSVVIDPNDPLRLFVVDRWDGTVWLSTDGGGTWTDRANGLPGNRIGHDLYMDPSNPDRLAVTCSQSVHYSQSIYRSNNAGKLWTPVATGFEPGTAFRGVDWDPARDRFAIAVNGSGVYLTDRGFVNDGLPQLDGFTAVRFAPASGALLLGTAGRSVWALDLEDPTAVFVPPAVANGLDLVVRPNPSAGPVHLELTLPGGRAAADVAIYSVAGRRVATIARGLAASGPLTWDGRDAAGGAAAPGVYFVRATAGPESRTRKLVLTGR